MRCVTPRNGRHAEVNDGAFTICHETTDVSEKTADECGERAWAAERRKSITSLGVREASKSAPSMLSNVDSFVRTATTDGGNG